MLHLILHFLIDSFKIFYLYIREQKEWRDRNLEKKKLEKVLQNVTMLFLKKKNVTMLLEPLFTFILLITVFLVWVSTFYLQNHLTQILKLSKTLLSFS